MRTNDSKKSNTDSLGERAGFSGAIVKKGGRPPVVLLLVLVIVAVASMAIVMLTVYQRPDQSIELSDEEAYAEELLSAESSDDNLESIVSKYGEHYDSAMIRVQESTPLNWNRDILDDAYRSLLYADRVGAFTQVNQILDQIEFAKNNGLEIDDNSYGIGQDTRDSIRQRASTLGGEMQDGSGAENE